MSTKKQDLDLIKQINKTLEAQKLTTKEVLELDKQRQELLKKWEEDASTQLQNSEENLKIMKEYAALTGDQVGVQDLLLDVAEKQTQVELDKLEAFRDQAKELGKMTPELAQQIADQEKILETSIKQKEALNKQNAAMEGVREGTKGLAMGLLGSVDASTTLAGQFFIAAGHAGGVGEVINNVGKALTTALNPANLMAGLFQRIGKSSKEAFFSMDNFRADLAKSGASLNQYSGLMANTTDQTIAAGVSMQDAQQSILALHSGMSSFNTMNKADQQVLTNTTAIMSKLGVDAQTSASNLDILTKSMGMNAKEADKATKEIAATAQALGVSQQKMAADFAAAAPALSAHGEAGVQIFRKLAAQSKATGIEMGALLGIANQFDTFEGAAEAAGKLNAVLGTQLNSIELLTASEDERIKILQQSVAASGKSWESMNKFEKQTVAAAAGISDVNEAGKLFGTTAQQMENAAGAAEKMALADKDLAKQAASASTASEKWSIIMERFALAMTPVVKTLHFFLDVIMTIDQLLGGTFIPTMIALVSIMFLASKAQALFNIVSGIAIGLDKIRVFWKALKLADSKKEFIMNKLLKKSTEELTEAEKKAADQNTKTQNTGGGFLKFLAKLGAILKRNAKGFLAFGAAMLMVGGGIALAALGLAEFVKSFALLSGEQLIAVTLGLLIFLGAMVAIAYFMTTLGLAAIGPMLAFGFAFLMIGAAIALAALGMSTFVKAFSSLDPAQISGVVAGMALFGLTMASLALIMMFAGPTMISSMLAFGAAFLMMGIGVALAAYGLAIMIPQLVMVADTLEDIVSQFVILAGIGSSLMIAALAVGMLTIAFGSLGMLSFVLLPIVAVLGILTLGVLALAAALSFIKTDDLRAVADMAQGLGSITVDSAVAFGKAMLETKETIVAIAKEPEAAQALTTMAQAFAPSPAGGGGTTTTTNNITSAATKSGGDSGNREIVLKLNKDVFARAVVNIFEKEQDLNKLG